MIGFLALGIKKPYLFTTLNVMGVFLILYDTSMDILHGKFISGNYGDMHHPKFLVVKGSFTMVKHNDKFARQRTFDWLRAALEKLEFAQQRSFHWCRADGANLICPATQFRLVFMFRKLKLNTMLLYCLNKYHCYYMSC